MAAERLDDSVTAADTRFSPLRATKSGLRTGLHRLYAAFARELEPENVAGPLLVIAPHADDETLGCAAVILRARRAERRVRVIIVTDGSRSVESSRITPAELAALRIEEAHAALAILGVFAGDVVFLAFPDGAASGQIAEIAEALRQQIAALQPTEIYAPYGIDGHADHRAIAAALDRLSASGAIACPTYEYPIWFWPWKALAHLGRIPQMRRLRRVSTAGLLAQKQAAMEAYRSQCENMTGEPDAWFLESRFLANFFTPYEFFFEKRR